jgi:hypothetical protein
VGAVSERFDFLAYGADLLFGGLRLHDNQHSEYPEILSLASGAEQGKRWERAAGGQIARSHQFTEWTESGV